MAATQTPAKDATKAADTPTKPIPVDGEQTSTGPAVDQDDLDDPEATKEYYLKAGRVHNALVKGDIRTLDKEGAKVDLTAAQYQAFQDKFHTKAEWNAVSAGKAELAKGAEFAGDPRMMEQSNMQEQQNADNSEKEGGASTTK